MRRLTIEKNITPRDSVSMNIFFAEMRNYPVMTREEELEMFRKYNRSKDEKVLEEIVKRNIKFVVSVAKQYLTSTTQFEDLVMAGCIGLQLAAQRFDCERGYKFSSFAVWYIRNDIILFIMNQRRIRVPAHTSLKVRKLQTKLDYGEDVTEDEYVEVMKYEETVSIASLDKKTDDYDLKDVIENKNSENPLVNLFNTDDINVINRLLDMLPKREKTIIEYYFGLNGKIPCNLDEIGEIVNLTRERVRQLKKSSLYKLKKILNSSGKSTYHSMYDYR